MMKVATMKRSVLVIALACAACAQEPVLKLPQVPAAAAFKEAQAPWVAAEPSAPIAWDGWWQAFGDAELDALEVRLVQNSPDLASALARYRQAQAVTEGLRGAQVPTVSASLNAQRDRQSELRPLRVLGPTSPNEYNSATLGLNVDYELDIWGRVQAQVAGGLANERAAEADLAAARLSLQAQLADTWLALRGLDQQAQLLQDTEKAYARALDLIQRRHDAGIAAGLDLARAQGQLESARSQRSQLQAQRAVMEHAVAALVGANASDFAVSPKVTELNLPAVPTGLPSTLLQRRPDIAGAQERLRAANAQVGVARAAIFPAVTLNAQGGYQSSDFGRFLQAPNLFWALGPNVLFTVFDGGRRKAETARSEAALEESAQRYRGTVLAAFQQVEDQLALIARYGDALKSEREAAAAAARAQTLADNRYRAGAVSYLEVVTSQTTELQARRNVLDLSTRQQRASVQLVRALGGGWAGNDKGG